MNRNNIQQDMTLKTSIKRWQALAALIAAMVLLASVPCDAQQKKQTKWKAPKRTKVKWKAPRDYTDPTIDVWRPYDLAENWSIEAGFGKGLTLAENLKGHSVSNTLGTLGTLAIARQTSYLLNTRLAVEFAQQKGWLAKGDVPLPTGIEPGKYTYNMLEVWLDERLSLTKALYPYDEHRKIDVLLFAGAGVNYSVGANKETKLWETMTLGKYKVDRTSHINMALRGGLQVMYAVIPAVDLWAQGAFSMIGDKHNCLLREQGGLEPCVDVSLGVAVHIPDRYDDYRYHKLSRTQAEMLRGRNAAVDKYYAREKERVEARRQAQRVEDGLVMQARVAFYIDRIFINERQMANVETVAAFLSQHPEMNIVIRGYSGVSRGCENAGLNLAQRRAEAVRQALVETYGVSEDRLTLWYDEEAPSPRAMQGEWIDAVLFEMVRRDKKQALPDDNAL